MEEDLWAQREEAERLHGEVKKKEFSGERRREEGEVRLWWGRALFGQFSRFQIQCAPAR